MSCGFTEDASALDDGLAGSIDLVGALSRELDVVLFKVGDPLRGRRLGRLSKAPTGGEWCGAQRFEQGAWSPVIIRRLAWSITSAIWAAAEALAISSCRSRSFKRA